MTTFPSYGESGPGHDSVTVAKLTDRREWSPPTRGAAEIDIAGHSGVRAGKISAGGTDRRATVSHMSAAPDDDLAAVTLVEPGPDGIRLRPWDAADIPVVHAAMQDPAMHRYLPIPDPYTEADARQFCLELGPGVARSGRGLGLGIENARGELVGGAGIRRHDSPLIGEIGYSVYAAHRGHGYAARAARVLTAWAFGHGLRRVELRIAVDNVASAKTALAAGFGFEGILRGDHPHRADMATTDGAVFARLPDDSGEPVPPWLPPLPRSPRPGDGVVEIRLLASAPDDLAAVRANLTDGASQRFTLGPPVLDPAVTAARAVDRAALGWLIGVNARLAVVEVATHRVAAIIEVRPAGPPRVLDLGYITVPEFRGRGLLGRGLRVLLDWLADSTDVARVELGTDVENTASQRVAERAGFHAEGVSRGRLRRADGRGFADERRYARVLTGADPGGTGSVGRQPSRG